MDSQTATATYAKLNDGTWGVRAPAGVRAGQQITVTKRDGSSKVETVDAVLWTGTAKDGRQASLVSIVLRARVDGGEVRREGGRKVCSDCGRWMTGSKFSKCYSCHREDAHAM